MYINNLNVLDGLNQKLIYEEFKKYCKFSTEKINDTGTHYLHVTNGDSNSYYAIDIEFIPKESILETVDRIFVHGFNGAGYSLESLLKIGYERLGKDAFNTKAVVDDLNTKIEMISKVGTSSHIR